MTDIPNASLVFFSKLTTCFSKPSGMLDQLLAFTYGGEEGGLFLETKALLAFTYGGEEGGLFLETKADSKKPED